MLIQKIVQELQDIPKDKLAEIYDLIHYFNLVLKQEPTGFRSHGLFRDNSVMLFFNPCQKRKYSNGNKLPS